MGQSLHRTQSRPKVSIVSISYNQENYIAQTLESFVKQKTNFLFEVIIADDASSDTTQKIISDYQKRYPSIIKPILRKKNVGIGQNIKEALTRTSGDYIALCEGDDYWTDNSKLQKQSDFLDSHKDHTVVFHPVRVVYEDGSPDEIYPAKKVATSFTLTRLLKENFIQTNTVLYRRMKSYDTLPTDILPLDWYLHLVHIGSGKIGFISDVMSVYRRHQGGVWWEAHNDLSKIWRQHGLNHLRLYRTILQLYGNTPAYKKIIDGHIKKMFDNIINLDDADDLQIQVIKQLPEMRDDFVKHLYRSYEVIEKKTRVLEQERDTKNHHLNLTAQRVNELEAENRLIKESRLWKMRNGIARVIGKDKV